MKKKYSILIDLAKQYAINQNLRQNITIVLVGSIFAVFGYVGFSVKEFVQKPIIENYYLLILSVVFSILIMSAIITLSFFYSYSLRRDQIVADKIRQDFFIKKKNKIFNFSEYERYFGTYKPNPSVQDFYVIIISSSIIIQLSTLLTFYLSIFLFNLAEVSKNEFIELKSLNIFCFISNLPLIIHILSTATIFFIYLHYKHKIEKQIEKHRICKYI